MDSTQINHTELPAPARSAMSPRQRSYIDEFEFHRLDSGYIEAWYAGGLVGTWTGRRWE